MAKWIWHVGPVENMLCAAQRLGAVLGRFVIFAPHLSLGWAESEVRRRGPANAPAAGHRPAPLKQFPLREQSIETGKSGGRRESSGRAERSNGTLSRRGSGRLRL